jgi:hypothetical protein
MKDVRCLVCMYKGLIVVGTNSDVIYQGKGDERKVQLCYHHSVELFKMGQTNFMSKYRENFHNFEADKALFSSFAPSRIALSLLY